MAITSADHISPVGAGKQSLAAPKMTLSKSRVRDIDPKSSRPTDFRPRDIMHAPSNDASMAPQADEHFWGTPCTSLTIFTATATAAKAVGAAVNHERVGRQEAN